MLFKHNKTIGKAGEDAACKFLKKKHYKILERNYLIRGGEIDIIAKDNDYIVFVEVKTRQNANYGEPLEAITSFKIQHLRKTALFYIQGLSECNMRFDVIAVNCEVHNDKIKIIDINHIENAF